MDSKKRYFATFDALRFFAFLKVFLSHIPIATIPILNFFRNGGEIGVRFFFVLSGFLITYILLTEKEETKTIDLRRFIIRRIFRIWPLYYLMVAFAFCTPYILTSLDISSSNSGYQPNWLLSIFFLENYKMIWTGEAPNVSPLVVMWSLCVEEHFYLVWGFLLYKIRVNKAPYLIGISLIIAFFSRIVFSNYNLPFLDLSTNIDYFAFGAVPAYLLVTKKQVFEEFFKNLSWVVKYIVSLLVISYVFISPYLIFEFKQFIDPMILGSMFSILICLTLPSSNALYLSKKHILSRLGVITYGLYMYHTIIINLLYQLCKRFQISLEGVTSSLSFILLSLFASVLLSVASYYLFERYFLSLKQRYSATALKYK